MTINKTKYKTSNIRVKVK